MSREISSLTKVRFWHCDPLGHLNNVRYLEYMLNAREDHFEQAYGFTYEEHIGDTGCTWVTVKSQIAYLREVRSNEMVAITSKTISTDERTSTVEILMTSADGSVTHCLLWITTIYFNLQTRKAVEMPESLLQTVRETIAQVEQTDFDERAKYLRHQNKKRIPK
ncbi:acyl-CoA thioester hydrolase [Cruoricaptor ignavus]|uniref:Acyl-CoA thioester hydrolase n=1 Tax=Cruoricaptor ignavus TaxID=1118202 RepID=A0A1M6CVZ6_9FLAO|nr:acyl-CoA thioesterase [Cruoricaptor ignavus]SHI64908.1 acyl-CoA thioester hydrolase [Cruoricaptor ignavus]